MQKTAYDMRISDWSSDVCSSDLICVGEDDPGLVRIGAALRVPCVDQLGPRSLARLGRVDHAVLLIGMDRLAGAARRQRPRGVALPGLMLPAHLVYLGPAVTLGKPAERPAGPHRLPHRGGADTNEPAPSP